VPCSITLSPPRDWSTEATTILTAGDVDPDGRAAIIVLIPPAIDALDKAVIFVGSVALAAYGGSRIYSEATGDASSAAPSTSAGDTAQDAGKAEPKPGSAGGPSAGKRFPESVKDKEREQSGNRCVFCGEETTREPGPNQSNIDHAQPKSRGGNNTPDNAQNTCRTCNLDKGTRTTEEYLRDLQGRN
jgi:hypothetical protein